MSSNRLPDTRVTTLDDGRDLAWMELGVADGLPVVAFHGTPGSRLQLAAGDEPAAAAGVRLISIDRPGYGLSTYQPRRRLVGFVDDVAHLADRLELARFGVMGVSGGGPYVAACARFLPRRVWGAGIISGVAPLTAPGDARGMTPLDRVLFRLARRSPVLVVPFFAAVAAAQRRRPERVLAIVQRTLGRADAAVLARPDVRAAFLADFHAATRTAARASAQDYSLFARDWGFRLEDIAVPVHLWHGDADRDVPVAQGRDQARRIPGAVLHECPGEGHLLAVTHFGEILDVMAGLA